LAKDEQRRKRLVEKFIISAKEARARFVARAVEMGYHVEVMDRRYGAIRIEGVPFKVHTPRRIFRGVGLKHDGYLVVRIESGDVWHAVTLPTGSYWIVAPEKVKKGAIYLRLDKLNEMEEEWPSVEALKEWIRINVRGGEE
jgi:hypothetical protein